MEKKDFLKEHVTVADARDGAWLGSTLREATSWGPETRLLSIKLYRLPAELLEYQLIDNR